MPRWKNGLQTSDEIYQLKRAAVLREATRIMARRGFHNTSLDEIAEALQVAKGTLYNYVKDKQEILFECHSMALDIGDQAFAFADRNGNSGYAKLRLMLRAYVVWMNGALGGGGIASDVTALGAAERKAVIKRRDEVERRLVHYIEEGWKDGTVRPVDAKLAVYAIMGAVNSVQSWYSPKGRLGIEEIATSIVDTVVHGIDTEADATYVDVPVPEFVAPPPVAARGEKAKGRSGTQKGPGRRKTAPQDAAR